MTMTTTTMTLPEIDGPLATIDEVLQCQLSSWYPTFSNIPKENDKQEQQTLSATTRTRTNVTMKSIIIDSNSLPSDFQDYLLSDGVQIPSGNDNDNNNNNTNNNNDNDSDWSDDDNDNDEDDDDDNNNQKQTEQQQKQQSFYFPQLNHLIHVAIGKLGGSVLPKLNWSAPKDATWVNGGTLKCEHYNDVYILIKSSDFCLHDVLKQAIKDCKDYNDNNNDNDNAHHQQENQTTTTSTTKEAQSSSSSLIPSNPPLQLILRKWANLHPSMEFRCFVRNHELLAISQRNHTQHYPHLMQDISQLTDIILDFFEDYIRHRFAQGTISNYVVDMYVDKQNRVWIVDFNIWAKSTDSLLFEWSELMTMDNDNDGEAERGSGGGSRGGEEGLPIVRIVETAQQVRQDPLASYRAPIDTVDLASMTKGDAKQFEEFMKQCRKPSELDNDDNDDNDD